MSAASKEIPHDVRTGSLGTNEAKKKTKKT